MTKLKSIFFLALTVGLFSACKGTPQSTDDSQAEMVEDTPGIDIDAMEEEEAEIEDAIDSLDMEETAVDSLDFE